MAQAIRHITSARRLIPGKNTELSVIIPAAGVGKRMKSKDAKSLIEIDNGTSLIERQLQIIWSTYPKSDVLLVIGYKAEKVREALKDYPVRFIYNPIYETTNVAFSISLALQASISETCLLVYGDLIFNEDAIGTITDGKSKILIDSNNHINDDEVGLIIDEDYQVTNFAFGLEKKWSQIAFLKGLELDLFKKACYKEDASKWFGYEALNEIINNGGELKSHVISSSISIDVDTPQDLIRAKNAINEIRT
jgi:choline kinase